METNNIEQHYRAFNWALSKNWKDRNGLYHSIRRKIESLTKEYQISQRDILDDLFSTYWERGHFENFESDKGSLNNWIAGYVNLYLNHLIRQQAARAQENPVSRLDPLDQRNTAQLVYSDRDNSKDDWDFPPEILIDRTDPESLLLAKELRELILNHFEHVELQYLIGELTLQEAAERTSISEAAFRKRIERRRAAFLDRVGLNSLGAPIH